MQIFNKFWGTKGFISGWEPQVPVHGGRTETVEVITSFFGCKEEFRREKLLSPGEGVALDADIIRYKLIVVFEGEVVDAFRPLITLGVFEYAFFEKDAFLDCVIAKPNTSFVILYF